MKNITLLITFSLVAISSLFAQKPSKQMVDKMTITVANLIKENYVLADKGEQIAEQFLKDLQSGRFYQATNLKKLDSIMCKSLREASNDHHLFVWNNYDIVRQMKADKDENEETESTSFFNNEKAYKSNFGFDKVEILPGNIGYIKLSQINISENSLKKLHATKNSLKKLHATMTMVEHTKALIIDLRNNGGGGSTIGSVLETYFFDKHANLLEFRERNGKTEMNSTVGWLLEKRYLNPLYLLVNKGTGSAAEAFAYALKSQNRCIVIGQPTSGGAYMNTYFPVNDDFIVAISTAAPFLPGTNKSWEGKGVQPDHKVEDEKALEKALELIKAN